MLSLALIFVLSYLAGSIPASVWAGKLMYGIDLREHGSGNAGATNAFRVLGFKAGVISTLVDMGKGALAAGLIAQLDLGDLPGWSSEWPSLIPLLAGVFAMIGHMYPIFAGFKGGKGVNTAAGVLLAVSPYNLLAVLVVFLLLLKATRYVSVASLVASVLFPTLVAIRLFVFDDPAMDVLLLAVSTIMASGIVYAHRTNIRRLRTGEEAKIKSFRPGKGLRAEGEPD